LEESKIISQPRNISQAQNIEMDYIAGSVSELNTTLADTTKFVDEIDRKTAKIPEVKPLKYKEIKAKSWKEFVTDANNQTDVHNLHKLMNMMTNDDILELFGEKHLNTYLAMKMAYEDRVKVLKAQDPNIKASAAKFRKMLLELASVQDAFYNNTKLAEKAWNKYVEKITEQNKKMSEKKELLIKKKKESALIRKPKRKFVGALLSKITPDQYRAALQEYKDAEKGKGLHKFASITPAKMIKELERNAYKDEKNEEVAKLLVNPEAYKVDDVSQGYKKLLKQYEEAVSKLPPE